MNNLCRHLATLFLIASAVGCSHSNRPIIHDGTPNQPPANIASIPDATPKIEPITRAGNPPTYTVLGKHYRLMDSGKGYVERGIASWYGTKFHGRKTSNGEEYDMYAMTAAHKTIPIPAYLRVTNLKNHRSIIVRVNDRGPFHSNRIIDLSYTAAAKLDILKTGTGFVEIKAIDPTAPPPKRENIKSIQKAGITDEIYLQIGAFGQHANALKLSQQIHDSKVAFVRIKTENGKIGPLYRVQIGPLESTDEVDDLIQRLIQFGVTKTHLIVKPKI
ncbi:MAG: septal ring lytic transglycosylase RlpA family lipoprotein [Gammaproteobacteria bacterium]|nr:MAG: septal ring lytic transglycosylase RlpA family lipoprotein [Gammaproteobacteria bacterium]RLA20814.1 MAG: septal ring lytic transglycosylase RlpA family lipoprotein [Gammaproteobacteria bacterium]